MHSFLGLKIKDILEILKTPLGTYVETDYEIKSKLSTDEIIDSLKDYDIKVCIKVTNN